MKRSRYFVKEIRSYSFSNVLVRHIPRTDLQLIDKTTKSIVREIDYTDLNEITIKNECARLNREYLDYDKDVKEFISIH